MNELDAQDRALLDLARDGHEPTDADRGRVRGALTARLGVGAGLVMSTTVAASTATAAATATATAGSVAGAALSMSTAKLIAVVVLAGAVGGGGLAAYHAARGPRRSITVSVPESAYAMTGSSRRTPASGKAGAGRAVVTAAATPSAPESPNRDVWSAPSTEPEAARVTDGARVVRVKSAALATAALTTPATSTSVAALAPAPSAWSGDRYALESETRLVSAGLAALHAGDAARALSLFDLHERDHPNGVLAEERSAERIFSLCALGRRSEARLAAEAFLRERPTSPLATRVRLSCGAPSNP